MELNISLLDRENDSKKIEALSMTLDLLKKTLSDVKAAQEDMKQYDGATSNNVTKDYYSASAAQSAKNATVEKVIVHQVQPGQKGRQTPQHRLAQTKVSL